MAIADNLRKAASLFFVMPEGGEKPRTVTEPSGAPTPAGEMSADDLDRRLAQMNATIQQIHTGATPDAAAGATSASLSAAPAQPQTIEEMLKRMEGPTLTEVSVSAEQVPAPTDGGPLDFEAIYAAAGLPATPFSAEQTLEMIHSFPATLPLDIKRQTVNATIATMGKTIGATPETIVADASRKLAALAAYESDYATQSETFITSAEAEIADLLARVDAKRQQILEKRSANATVKSQCDAEADRLDDILEFFSLDIGSSKYATSDPNLPPPLPPGT